MNDLVVRLKCGNVAWVIHGTATGYLWRGGKWERLVSACMVGRVMRREEIDAFVAEHGRPQ